MKTYEPIYPHTSIYAREHGELEAFRASNRTNMACKEALEKAISDNYDGRRLDTKAVYNTVVEEYGAERVKLMLANTIQVKGWDGRISPYNKTWAKEIPMPESFGEPGSDRRLSYAINAHPGLVDMAATTFQQEEAMQERAAAAEKPDLNEQNTALYQKMVDEQDTYRAWLLTLPQEEILNHAYEYAVRQDILYALETNDLESGQAEALLHSPCPLADVFNDWAKKETSYMEDIWKTVQERANQGVAMAEEPARTPEPAPAADLEDAFEMEM